MTKSPEPAPYFQTDQITLYHGHALAIAKQLPSRSVQTIITSPPYYGLRDYQVRGQYGTEKSLRLYVAHQVALFRELRRVLANKGTLWLVLGDSYAGRANGGRMYEQHREFNLRKGLHSPGVMPPRLSTTGDAPFKNLLLVPAKVAIAMQRDGWVLRNDIVWRKPNAKPESVKDRMGQTYEHIYMFSKRPHYYYDLRALRDHRSPTARAIWESDLAEDNASYSDRLPNPGDVWDIPVTPFPGAHFATFPLDIPRRAIMASTKAGDTVLDPFHGSGTTAQAATELWPARKYIGIDLNEDYLKLSLQTRLATPVLVTGE